MQDFDVVDVGGTDWFYFSYCSLLSPLCGSSHIAVSRPIYHNYLPVVLSNPSGFPLFVGNAIPTRPVNPQGEIFFSKQLQILSTLPSDGHFYFSTQSGSVTPVLVDDEIAIILNGAKIFSYDFSQSGTPTSATLEVPRIIMQQIAGQTVTIQYKDIYGKVVKATSMWLIWTP
ncbi:MAG: hypothetical protein U0401_25060 [Anaerolineae bacterium]